MGNKLTECTRPPPDSVYRRRSSQADMPTSGFFFTEITSNSKIKEGQASTAPAPIRRPLTENSENRDALAAQEDALDQQEQTQSRQNHGTEDDQKFFTAKESIMEEITKEIEDSPEQIKGKEDDEALVPIV